MGFLEWIYFGNMLQTWLFAFLIIVAVMAGLRILRTILVRRATTFTQETQTDWDDLISKLLTRTRIFFLFIVSVYTGSLVLVLSPRVREWVGTIMVIALLAQTAIWGDTFISFWLARYRKRHLDEDAASVTTLSALGFVARLTLFSVIVLLALDNIPGVQVTALIASLGVGGVAVALAVQSILADLFASLSITLDKPFVIGDFIIVDDYMGSVEHIGLKTTRIRSVSGEQLIFANSDLLNSRIRNFKRMRERRAVFSIGVTYETPYEKLVEIPSMIRGIIEAQEKTRFDRAHFKELGDFSLNFEAVYYVLEPDYSLYMDIQQAINLALFQRFEEEGIEFAYPTQTLYVSNGREAVLTGVSEKASV